jgi:hypothetical protein
MTNKSPKGNGNSCNDSVECEEVDNVNNDNDNNNNARFILDQLKGNFIEEGKTTCRSCLRSKTLPCRQVLNVVGVVEASSSSIVWTVQLLHQLQEIIIQEYAHFPLGTNDEKNVIFSTTTATTTIPTTTSLSCMSQAVTGLRFVQLLLLLLLQKNNNSISNNRSLLLLPLVPPGTYHKIIVTVLEHWIMGICDFVRHTWKNRLPSSSSSSSSSSSQSKTNDDDNDTSNTTLTTTEQQKYNAMTADASIDLDPRPVFCFTFMSLLRMNEYVKTTGGSEILVPVWKGIGKFANLLAELHQENLTTCTQEDDQSNQTYWSDSLPSFLLPNAMQILNDFLQEGIRRMAQSVLPYYNYQAPEVISNTITNTLTATGIPTLIFQSKIINFLAIQLSPLMCAYLLLYESQSESNNNNTNNWKRKTNKQKQQIHPNDTPTEVIVSDCWKTLLELRGIATAFPLLNDVNKKNFHHSQQPWPLSTTKEDCSNHVSTLPILCQLAATVEKVCHDILLTNQQHPVNTSPNHSYAQLLVLSAMPSIFMAANNNNNNIADCVFPPPPTDILDQFQHISQAIGTVTLLQSILTSPVVTTLTISTLTTTNDEIGTVLLSIVEHLLFQSIPRCLAALQLAVKNKYHKKNKCVTLPSKILSHSLQAMVDVLIKFETMTSSCVNQLHRLFLRWLAAGGGKTQHQQQHPVTREMVLSLLQAYISSTVQSTTRISDNNNAVVVGSTRTFISQLTKLLLDDRATPILRRNTSALLVRLQVSSSGPVVTEVARQLVEDMLEEGWMHYQHNTPITKSSRKRKRSQRPSTTKIISKATDLMEIWQALTGRGLSNRRLTGKVPIFPKTLRTLYESSIHNPPKTTKMLLLSAPGWYMVAMAFLQRFFLSGMDGRFEDCNKIFTKQVGVDAINVVNAFLTAIVNISFASTTTDDDDDDATKTIHKKVMLFWAAMRLAASVNETLGGQDKHSQAPIDTSLSLVTKTISKRFLAKQEESVAVKYRVLFRFVALEVLQSLGRAIGSECQEQILQVRGLSFLCFPIDSFFIVFIFWTAVTVI